MELSVKEIAGLTKARVLGNGTALICGASSFDDAGPGDLTFASDPKFLAQLDRCRAGAVLVPDTFDGPWPREMTLLVSSRPKIVFFDMVARFYPQPRVKPGIHPAAVIGQDLVMGKDVCIEANVTLGQGVTIGSHVHIMANTYVGDNCTIGDHTVIKPNVSLMDKTEIGCHVIIHPNAVIGSDGFGFAQESGTHAKLIHTGFVRIGDHAEIGACTTIDRGTLGVTEIGNGVKTDNQVHIAHNVKIGDNTLVVAQVGIAGSTRIGKQVIIAGKAGISGHLTIGDNAIVGPYAGVSSNVPAGEIVSGIPHMPHKTWLKAANMISRLPGLRKKVLSFENRLKRLEGKDTE